MHSVVAVIGNGSLDEAMAPFDENIEVEEYVAETVSEWDKNRMMRYYSKKDGVEYTDFEECYRKHGEEWNEGQYRKGDDGEWYRYSTWNEDSHWDWYAIGGRWMGLIRLKEGAEAVTEPHPHYSLTGEALRNFGKEMKGRADAARICDIANLDEILAGDILINGEWINIEDGDGRFLPVAPYLEGLPEDTVLTIVDYHY